MSGGRILRATRRSSWMSRARMTAAMPPTPIGSINSKWASRRPRNPPAGSSWPVRGPVREMIVGVSSVGSAWPLRAVRGSAAAGAGAAGVASPGCWLPPGEAVCSESDMTSVRVVPARPPGCAWRPVFPIPASGLMGPPSAPRPSRCAEGASAQAAMRASDYTLRPARLSIRRPFSSIDEREEAFVSKIRIKRKSPRLAGNVCAVYAGLLCPGQPSPQRQQ